MKIALINENSQAAKNELICNTLKSVVEPLGHEVFNYGMYSSTTFTTPPPTLSAPPAVTLTI